MKREHLVKSDGSSHLSTCHQKEESLWQQNMPNIRIAIVTSHRWVCLARLESARGASHSRNICDDGRAFSTSSAAHASGTQTTFTGGRARARRGGSAKAGG